LYKLYTSLFVKTETISVFRFGDFALCSRFHDFDFFDSRDFGFVDSRDSDSVGFRDFGFVGFRDSDSDFFDSQP
jgi:hypothetical protein